MAKIVPSHHKVKLWDKYVTMGLAGLTVNKLNAYTSVK